MVDTVARYRNGTKIFETMVDLDSAVKLKKGEDVSISDVIRDNLIWSDLKKGLKPGNSELEEVFGTTELATIVEKIVKRGELEVTQEFRSEELEKRRKQVVDFLVKNAVDVRTNRPYTPEVIESAIKQAGIKIENQNVDKQIGKILEKLKPIIPIKIETKTILVNIPAEHTGRAYGIIAEYKEKESWLSNGDLALTLKIPVGLQMEFYDKLNGITHGSATTEEVREEEE